MFVCFKEHFCQVHDDNKHVAVELTIKLKSKDCPINSATSLMTWPLVFTPNVRPSLHQFNESFQPDSLQTRNLKTRIGQKKLANALRVQKLSSLTRSSRTIVVPLIIRLLLINCYCYKSLKVTCIYQLQRRVKIQIRY